MRRDLFSDNENAGYVADAELLQKLVAQKLDAAAADYCRVPVPIAEIDEANPAVCIVQTIGNAMHLVLHCLHDVRI